MKEAFIDACKDGNSIIVQFLYDCGMKDVNGMRGMFGCEPLKMAAFFHHYDVVDFLLSTGAKVEKALLNVLT
jgi:hypothetical protein